MRRMHATAIDQPQKAAARLPMTPGRRLALLFGVPACLALVAAAGFSLVSQVGTASMSVSYQFPAAASRVSVTSSGGQVLLRESASSTTATLTGTADYSLVRPHFTHEFNGGVAYYDYRCTVGFVNCALNATVSVPRGIAVTVNTGGGNVTAQGDTGDITLSTGGGDVTADRIAGVLGISTGGGDIQADAISAPQVTANTGGGDITITFTTPPRDVQVSTGGGDITIILPPGNTQYHLTTEPAGGSLGGNVPDDTSSPNTITATSGGGDITIRQGTP